MQAVDLHVHSNRSDGTFSPSQLVDYARAKGLKAFALTDHDTVDGLEEAVSYAKGLRSAQTSASEGNPESENLIPSPLIPEVIPGIEFSTEYISRDGHSHDIHVLGLYIGYQDTFFQKKLTEFVDSRILRNQKMCRLLREAGMDISYEGLLAEFPDAVITRAHYAKYMQRHGFIQSIGEAFECYIGDGCPCYVPREKVTPAQAVKLVLAAGGVPILAHPVLYHLCDEELELLTKNLANAGLAALEAIYSTYTAAEERSMRRLASKYGLLVSGGSDFHGDNKPGLDLGCGYGKLFIPSSVLDDIRLWRKHHLDQPV